MPRLGVKFCRVKLQRPRHKDCSTHKYLISLIRITSRAKYEEEEEDSYNGHQMSPSPLAVIVRSLVGCYYCVIAGWDAIAHSAVTALPKPAELARLLLREIGRAHV